MTETLCSSFRNDKDHQPNLPSQFEVQPMLRPTSQSTHRPRSQAANRRLFEPTIAFSYRLAMQNKRVKSCEPGQRPRWQSTLTTKIPDFGHDRITKSRNSLYNYSNSRTTSPSPCPTEDIGTLLPSRSHTHRSVYRTNKISI